MSDFYFGQFVKFKDSWMEKNPSIYEKTFLIGKIENIIYNLDAPTTFVIEEIGSDLKPTSKIYYNITCVEPLTVSECRQILYNKPIYISTGRGEKKSFMDNYVKRALNSFYGLSASLSKEEFKKSIYADNVEHIYYNKARGITVVIFGDGTKIIKKLCEGDTFDLRTAVALAISEKLYGSKTKFNKMIEKLSVDQGDTNNG